MPTGVLDSLHLRSHLRVHHMRVPEGKSHVASFRRRRRAALVLSPVMVGALLLPGLAGHASAATQGGISPTKEVVVNPGWVIDTIVSANATIKVFGRSGQTFTAPTEVAGTYSFSTTSPDLKKAPAAAAGTQNSAVAALIALGVDPATALREFGGLDSLDGSTPDSDQAIAAAAIAAASTPTQAATSPSRDSVSLAGPVRPGTAALVTEAVTVSRTVPYDIQCITVDIDSHLLQGQGCSTLYVVWANGADWFFANKYKFSMQSTSTRYPFPIRLKGVDWRLAFSSTGGNQLYDWDPSSTRPVGSCATLTVGSAGDPAHGNASISISATICPDSEGPWGPINSYQSGSQWNGFEGGAIGGEGDWEATIGTQELHNPATASASHTSSYNLYVTCGLDPCP